MMEVCETFVVKNVSATLVSKSKKYASERFMVRRKDSGPLAGKKEFPRLTNKQGTGVKSEEDAQKLQRRAAKNEIAPTPPRVKKNKNEGKKASQRTKEEVEPKAKKEEAQKINEENQKVKEKVDPEAKKEEDQKIPSTENEASLVPASGPETERLSNETIMQTIREWVAKNDECIARISALEASSDQYVQDFSYVVRSEPTQDTRDPFKLTVIEVKGVVSCKQHIEHWKVPGLS